MYSRVYSFLETISKDFIGANIKPLHGGDVSQVYEVKASTGKYCLKFSDAPPDLRLFNKEAQGLGFISSHTSLVVPEVLGVYSNENGAGVIMTLLDEEVDNDREQEKLGRGLAELHQNYSNPGFKEDNFIAGLDQINNGSSKWSEFFVENRLLIQLESSRNSLGDDYEFLKQKFWLLKEKLPDLPCSLLHGDLWSGNYMITTKGPAIIDPAIYFGHNEVDLAMTKLFGGFSSSFYSAYHEVIPKESGFDERIDWYNLYPLLVHLNLFGRSYLPEIRSIAKGI